MTSCSRFIKNLRSFRALIINTQKLFCIAMWRHESRGGHFDDFSYILKLFCTLWALLYLSKKMNLSTKGWFNTQFELTGCLVCDEQLEFIIYYIQDYSQISLHCCCCFWWWWWKNLSYSLTFLCSFCRSIQTWSFVRIINHFLVGAEFISISLHTHYNLSTKKCFYSPQFECCPTYCAFVRAVRH